jgi:hypothetical protein
MVVVVVGGGHRTDTLIHHPSEVGESNLTLSCRPNNPCRASAGLVFLHKLDSNLQTPCETRRDETRRDETR